MTRTAGGGTLQWQAPEMLDEDPEGQFPASRKTMATDIWALGCTFYEVFDGLP
jgi:serine/threonine protein kinase